MSKFNTVTFVVSVEMDYEYLVERKIEAYSLKEVVAVLESEGIRESQIKNWEVI